MTDKYYKIGEIAKLVDVTPVTLRHYQKINLLLPSFRSESGYRLYIKKDLQRLKFILNAKAVGFKLKEIKELLHIVDTADTSAKVKAVLNVRLQDIEAQIKNFTYIKKALKELNRLCDGTVQVDKCPIIKKLRSNP